VDGWGRSGDGFEEGAAMEILGFTANTVVALVMGVAIGLERQYRQPRRASGPTP
jgi:uncharacterized membrane protein YhiD involved in acid resistance